MFISIITFTNSILYVSDITKRLIYIDMMVAFDSDDVSS